VCSFHPQLHPPGRSQHCLPLILGDSVVLLEVAHDFPQTGRPKAQVAGRLPHHLLGELGGRGCGAGGGGEGGGGAVLDEVVDEGVLVVFLKAKVGVDEVVVAVVLKLEV
jgi:hypothetical protein